MKLFNTLTKQKEDFTPVSQDKIGIYSCGPTVYERVHIGNLSSFITADTLRRTLLSLGYKTHHVMNYTDIDDKTIHASHTKYTDMDPMDALTKLTSMYIQMFLSDMNAVGNDTKVVTFLRATDYIPAMQDLIRELHKNGFAYIAEDGIYFSIKAYTESGKTYGQLTPIDSSNTSHARINNDEYDKTSVHDFVLWKRQRPKEPYWDFELDGTNMPGRPGWHIECSVMSVGALGMPFDIHTGGVDLTFPHHENEIAQSTAGREENRLAAYFIHNEHVLVDGKKMSKSLKNFYTIDDIVARGKDPLAFRLLTLQSHYRSQSNFTWEELDLAHERLQELRAFADLRFQATDNGYADAQELSRAIKDIQQALADDLNTSQALTCLYGVAPKCTTIGIHQSANKAFIEFLEFLDAVFGLQLLNSDDISEEQKQLLKKRANVREAKDWTASDTIRAALEEAGIQVNDTASGQQLWLRK